MGNGRAVRVSSGSRAAEMLPVGRLVLVSRGPRGQLLGGRRLPAELVGADQRERLLAAVVAVVGTRGLGDARVRDVLWLAGVSQPTFYEHFAGVDDLLLSACDRWLADLLDELERAMASRRRWTEGVREGLRYLLEGVAAQPELAHCCFLELCGLGSAGEECRRRALERLAVLLRTGSGTSGGLSVSDELLAGGVWHAIGAAVLSTGTRELGSLLSGLHEHVLTYGGVSQD